MLSWSEYEGKKSNWKSKSDKKKKLLSSGDREN